MGKVINGKSQHLLPLKTHLDLLIPLMVLWFSWHTGFYTPFQCLEPEEFHCSFWKLVTALRGWVMCHGARRSLLLHLNCSWTSLHIPPTLLTLTKSLERWKWNGRGLVWLPHNFLGFLPSFQTDLQIPAYHSWWSTNRTARVQVLKGSLPCRKVQPVERYSHGISCLFGFVGFSPLFF